MFSLKYHKMITCLMKPFPVRRSSKSSSFVIRNPKLTSEINLIRHTLNENDPPTTNDWRTLRDQLKIMLTRNESPFNVDTLVMACCLPTELNAGKSYMRYLTETGEEPDLNASINLLKLYYRASKVGIEINNEDQSQIVAMYEKFAAKFPTFDTVLAEGVIYGLVLTNNWRKSLDILDSIKIAAVPSPAVYSAVIQRAIADEDEKIVWTLMHDMVNDCKSLQKEVFLAYIGYCEKYPAKFTENINRMLTFIGDNQIVLTTEISTRMHRAFERFDNYVCSITAVSKSGKILSNRNKRLRSVHVTDDEFNTLSDHFLDETFTANKTFGKSTPKEFDSFIKFINRTKPYDIVVDGLNVAYSTQPAKLSNAFVAAMTLANFVKQLVDQKKKLLVIGRKFMANWPKNQMDYVRSHASLFLTENSSQDDSFFLYATLKSGPQTDFVTRDLIRDQAYELDDNLKRIFRQWQLQHQQSIQYVCDRRGVIFRERIQFDMTAQQVDNCWYIPFENQTHCTFQWNNFEMRKNWLCVCRKDDC